MKTLKDIIEARQKRHEELLDSNRILLNPIDKVGEELKAEAIRWIKELKVRENYQQHTERSSKNDLIHSIDWIMWFFGISGDDLK